MSWLPQGRKKKKKVVYLLYSYILYIICIYSYVFLYIALQFTGLQADGREYPQRGRNATGINFLKPSNSVRNLGRWL